MKEGKGKNEKNNSKIYITYINHGNAYRKCKPNACLC